jgi:hypothetical protein
MKRAIIVLFLISGAALATYKSLGNKPARSPQTAVVQREEYLVRFGGCSDCHTPKRLGAHGSEDDLSRYLSGPPETVVIPEPALKPTDAWNAGTAGMTAWAGPWDINYAANLIPDKNTGLGIWTEEMFIKAMRPGKHFGESRAILPPMPWRCLSQLTDTDLKAIFVYLQTIPPVCNHVPEPVAPTDSASFE